MANFLNNSTMLILILIGVICFIVVKSATDNLNLVVAQENKLIELPYNNTEKTFLTYENPYYGIKVDYPKGLEVQEGQSSLVSFIRPYTSMVDVPESFNIRGLTQSIRGLNFEEFSIEQFKSFMIQLINFSKPIFSGVRPLFEYQIIDVSKIITNNGYSAFKLEFAYNETDPIDPSIIYQYKGLQIWISSGNNLIGLEYKAHPSKYSTYLPIAQKMIDSFVITNVNVTLPKTSFYETAKEKFSTQFPNTRSFVATSNSMEPYLKPNDIFMVSNSTSFDALVIGDVIVFKKPSNNSKVVVSRVANIELDSEGKRILTTKGDSNPFSLPGTDFPVRKDSYIGKVVKIIVSVSP